MCSCWSVFFQCVYSFQASACSPEMGHVLDFCIMMIIWGFRSVGPLTHARLNRMSPAPPVPPFQLPRLSECLYSVPTAVTNLSVPGVHGAQDAQDTQANKLPGWLGQKEHLSATRAPSAPPIWHQGPFGPLLLLVDLSWHINICTETWVSQLQTCIKKEKMDWPCAILPDALPQHAGLTIISACCTASSLFTPDEARCSLS